MNIQTICEKFQLNDDEKNLLIYMNDHRSNLKSINIRKLAQQTYYSPGFIIKTCKKMGLSGYSELVFLITDTPYFPSNSESDLKVKEYAKPFFEILDRHRNSMIMILGSGYSQNIANYMSEYLNQRGFRCTSNSHLEILRMQSDSLIIIISNSGETKRLSELCFQAKENNHDVIAFVGNRHSRIGDNATLTISTDTFNPSAFSDYYPQLFFGFSLIYFELLMGTFMSR